MRIVFMGTPMAAVPSLERCLADGHEVAAVYSQPDRPAGRGNRVTAPPVKRFAEEHGVPVLQPEKIRTPEALDRFRSHGADVAVVVAYGRILPVQLLTACPYGAVNVHFSLLPKYRGAAPVNWAIVNGEVETGVTTMKMDEGLDTGPILLQERTQIGPDETAVELTARLATLGAELLSRTLAQIDTLTPRAQDHGAATSAPLLNKELGIIDWTSPAADIAYRVRGFQPFPTAYTVYNGRKLTIWAGHPTETETESLVAGTLLAAGTELVVSCGRNALAITELQIEGKRRMTAADFVNGYHPTPGEVLGN